MRVGRVVRLVAVLALGTGLAHAENGPSAADPPTASFPPAEAPPPAPKPPKTPAPSEPAPPPPEAPPLPRGDEPGPVLPAAPPPPGEVPPPPRSSEQAPPVSEPPRLVADDYPGTAPPGTPNPSESNGSADSPEQPPKKPSRPRGWSGRGRPPSDESELADPGPTERHWYGGETLIADGVSIGAIILGADTNTSSLVGLGIAGYFLAAPIVHWSHGQGGTGGLSFALRLIAPGAFVAGFASCDSEDGSGAGCALGVLGLLMIPGAMVIDAAVLAREEVPVEESGWLRGVSPWYSRRNGAGGVSFTGAF